MKTWAFGDCHDVARHNLFWPVGVIESAIAQLAIMVEAHGPQAAVALEKKAVAGTCGNSCDIAGHNLLGVVDVVGSAITQLAATIGSHRPQTTVVFKKYALTCSNC